MKSYTVHHKTGDVASITARPEQLVFVPEAFCWIALFIPLIWLLFRRMWVVAAIFFAALATVSAIGVGLDIASWVMIVISVAMNLFIAWEGNELRRWSLARRGMKMIDIVTGKSQAECELEFFRRLGKDEAKTGTPRSAQQRTPTRLAAQPDDGGLFPVTGSGA